MEQIKTFILRTASWFFCVLCVLFVLGWLLNSSGMGLKVDLKILIDALNALRYILGLTGLNRIGPDMPGQFYNGDNGGIITP